MSAGAMLGDGGGAAAAAALGALAPAPTGDRLLLVLVGLPARGKSYVANKLVSFLRWRGVAAENFNVGAARRQAETTARETASATFFSSANEQAKALREQLAMGVLHGALDWLAAHPPGSVAVLDATNTTRERRRHLLENVAAWAAARARAAAEAAAAATPQPQRGPLRQRRRRGVRALC
jgi:predicted kinase